MFIQTESTPNPATLKFLPGRPVMEAGVAEFETAGEAAASPLAQRLFAVSGVARVFLGPDFISVTQQGTDWAELKTSVLGAILEHFTSGDPVIAASAGPDGGGHGAYEGEDAEVVEQIKDLLDTRIRPAVAQDGGDIVFHSYDAGTVYLHMRGACAGCPSATFTLKQGIENMLRHYIPEVEAVEPV